MITVWNEGGYYRNGAAISVQDGAQAGYRPETGRTKTMAYGIMAAHNHSGDMQHMPFCLSYIPAEFQNHFADSPQSTTFTVRNRIFTSSHKDRFLIYSIS